VVVLIPFHSGAPVRTKTPGQADKILAAAARLFSAHRFHEARMEDIAAAAEVGKGTLYRYFKDKDELYQALLAQAAREITARLRDEVARAGGPRARLEAIVACCVAYFDEQPHLFDLINHAEAMSRIDALSEWQRARDDFARMTRAAFDDAAAAGAFVIADPEVAVLMLLGGLRSVIRFGARPRPADLARRVVDGFLHGAAAPAPAGRNGHRTTARG
jgi:AcrR family transcriptional regulator